MDRIRISFEVEGELAKAFLRELAKQVPASKAEVGRTALVEYLNARGHKVMDDTQRGGYRGKQEESTGQYAGAIAV